MAQENVLSGDTPNNHEVERPTFVYIQEIYDEDYDEDLQTYKFSLFTYSGLDIQLNLRKRDIERFVLFMRKTDAELKYISHIINNN